MKMEKNSNINIPQEKDLGLKKKQIRNTNTQYICQTSHYVKTKFERKPLNNDIQYNKTIYNKIITIIILSSHLI
jgi:hypothetical protein